MPDSKRCVNTVNALWYIARTHNYGRHLFLHKIDTWIFYQLKKRRQSKAAPSSLVCRAEPCWSAAATLLCTVCLTNAFPQACSSEFDSSGSRSETSRKRLRLHQLRQRCVRSAGCVMGHCRSCKRHKPKKDQRCSRRIKPLIRPCLGELCTT